jgi:hypothetical protein
LRKKTNQKFNGMNPKSPTSRAQLIKTTQHNGKIEKGISTP